MGSKCSKCCSCCKRQNILHRNIPNIFVCGLEGTGKTTLVYKTLIPKWENVADVESTAAFHCETISYKGSRALIWEVSGKKSLRSSWSTFYNNIAISAIVFVVSQVDTSSRNIEEARILLHNLRVESNLKDSIIIVVLNSFGLPCGTSMPSDRLKALLGISGRESKEKNILSFVVDVKNGLGDTQWQKAMQLMFNHFRPKAKKIKGKDTI